MAKRFIKGNVYVFTKKKFIQSQGKSEYKRHKEWVDIVNGQQVTFHNPYTGNAGNLCLCVMPECCKCIKINMRGGGDDGQA